MHFSTVALFVVSVAFATAAPATNTDSQQKLVNDMKKAFEPVAAQVRTLLDNGEKALETVGVEASKAGERMMDSAKNMFSDMQKADRANLPENLMDRAADLKEELQADVRTILAKAAESAEPMKGNLRSIIFGARDAMDMLKNKYLTKDGQELLRSVASMAGANFHANLPEAPKAPAPAPAA